MGVLNTKPDPVTKSIIFGGQKQSDRVNDALAIFADDYIDDNNNMLFPGIVDGTSPDWTSAKINSIIACLEDIASKINTGEELTEADKLFAKIFVGLQDFSKIGPGCSFGYQCVTDTGKYVFYVVSGGQGSTGMSAPTGNVAQVIAHANKTASKEEEALALIEEILKDCPNRGDYPEDDALAAIMYGEVYWKGVK